MQKYELSICPKCKTEFNAWSPWKTKKFCSRACANSRIRTDEIKSKISNSLRKSSKAIEARNKQKQKFKVNRHLKTCPVCNTNFEVRPSEIRSIYCSRACYIKDNKQQYRPKSKGGYREGSGHSHSGYYKGIYCGSTYELCWVIYSLDHGIKFKRFSGYIGDSKFKYYPDFILDDNSTIIEIKGYEKEESVNTKTQLAINHGYEVKVLRKDDLLEVFDYVNQHYSNNYKSLYDQYKPRFNYVCNKCNRDFSLDRKRKSTKVYCSRKCSILGNKQNNQGVQRSVSKFICKPL